MIRTVLQMSRGLAMAVVSLPSVLASQTPDKRQIVAVLPFDNASFGPSAHDYDLVGKGIQDLLVTELASSAQVRVVDRAHLQAVMDEQKIARDQLADPATQVRLGKILNAHFLITGSLITDGKSQLQMTARTIDVETSVVGNPEKITGKPDDLLGIHQHHGDQGERGPEAAGIHGGRPRRRRRRSSRVRRPNPRRRAPRRRRRPSRPSPSRSLLTRSKKRRPSRSTSARR